MSDIAKNSSLGSATLEEPPAFVNVAEIEAYISRTRMQTALSNESISLDALISPDKITQAVERATVQWVMDRTKRLLDHALDNGELTATSPLLKTVLDRVDVYEGKKKNDVFSVCVRPRHVDDVEKFISTTHKHVTSKLYKTARYCFETASDMGEMSGIHLHMLLRTNNHEKPSLIKQRVAQSFKTFGDVNIQVQSLHSEEKIKNTELYIGKLPGPDSSKHQDDILLRSTYNLENYYVHTN